MRNQSGAKVQAFHYTISGHIVRMLRVHAGVAAGVSVGLALLAAISVFCLARLNTSNSRLYVSNRHRGDAFQGTAGFERAVDEYARAISLTPEVPGDYNNRGHAQLQLGDYDHAIMNFSRALAIRPEYPHAYDNRGAAYFADGHPVEAIQDYSRALELEPGYTRAYSNRAKAYLQAGDLRLALVDFRRAGTDAWRSAAIACGVTLPSQ